MQSGKAVVLLLCSLAAGLFLAGWTVKTWVKDGIQASLSPLDSNTNEQQAELVTQARVPHEHLVGTELRDVTHLASADASSTLPPDGPSVYTAANAIDGSLATSWQPSAKRTRGVGEFLNFTFSEPVLVAQIEVANGFQHSWGGQDLFSMNARLDETEIIIGRWSSRYRFASDQRGYHLIQLEPPILTRELRIVARSVHRGTRWPDLAISEVRFKALDHLPRSK